MTKSPPQGPAEVSRITLTVVGPGVELVATCVNVPILMRMITVLIAAGVNTARGNGGDEGAAEFVRDLNNIARGALLLPDVLENVGGPAPDLRTQ